MSPQIRRIIGLVAIVLGAILLGKDGVGWRPIGLIGVGIAAIFLSVIGQLTTKK
jgi:hypothetical protein